MNRSRGSTTSHDHPDAYEEHSKSKEMEPSPSRGRTFTRLADIKNTSTTSTAGTTGTSRPSVPSQSYETQTQTTNSSSYPSHSAKHHTSEFSIGDDEISLSSIYRKGRDLSVNRTDSHPNAHKTNGNKSVSGSGSVL